MMKVIKKHTEKATPLKDQFTIGESITWFTTFFDGRVSETIRHTGTVVKVNRVTVDVILENGDTVDTVRLDEWDLGTVIK